MEKVETRKNKGARLAIVHLATTCLATALGVLFVVSVEVICDPAMQETPDPDEFAATTIHKIMFGAVIAAGLIGSLVGFLARPNGESYRIAPSISMLAGPYALLMTTFILLRSDTINGWLKDWTGASVHNWCFDWYRLTAVTVPLLMFPVLAMLVVAYWIGAGKLVPAMPSYTLTR